MGNAVLALLVFIGIIIFWNVFLKRNIGEAMFFGFIGTALFGGTQAPKLIWDGLVYAATYEVMYAALAFVFMSYLIDRTEVLSGMLLILNSIFGRLPGGAAYIDTIASAAMGTLAGSGSANTAATGAFTAPWMVKTNWSRELAATVVAGNGGLGTALPPSSSMFIMLGFAPVAALVSEVNIYIALFVAGAYQVLYRMILIMYLVRKHKIKAVSPEFVQPLSQSLRIGWKSLFIFLGALIPMIITIGPVSEMLAANPNIGEEAMGSISLITWIPILIIFIGLIVGWTKLPKSSTDWSKFLNNAIPRFAYIGAILLFAFAAGEVLSNLGLAEDLTSLMETLSISKWLMIAIIGGLVILVAGPLSSTATLTAVGMISFSALISVGVHPVAAVICILVFASTEGSSPPASGSIFISAGLAGADPKKMFVPLITYYVVPIFIIGWLIGMGVLPLPIH
ncbi:TRAP transporter large permease subunit [Bacillus sp. JJ634]